MNLRDPSPELLSLFGAASPLGGPSVTATSAMRNSVCAAAVRSIAESIGQLPVHAYRRLPDGGRERVGADQHPAASLLSSLNPWTSRPELVGDMQVSLLLHGFALAAVTRDGQGRPIELHPLPCGAVSRLIDDVTHEPFFRLARQGGGEITYRHDEVLHLRAIGGAPLDQARSAIGLAMLLEQHGTRLFTKGARPAGLLTTPKLLTPDAARRLRESFESAFAGVGNAGETLLLEGGMGFTQAQLTSVDAQYLELRRFQVQEISRAFRVPLVLVGDLERVTHSNAEELGAQFVSYTLLPWIELWEAALCRALFTTKERREYYVEFLLDDLARANLAARFTSYAQAIQNGLLSPNEVRARENLPGYRGGDVRILPLNSAPAGKEAAP